MLAWLVFDRSSTTTDKKDCQMKQVGCMYNIYN
jgi:hypothetical protein